MSGTKRKLTWWLALVLGAGLTAQAEEATPIKIWPQYLREVGGQSEVQRIFGGCVNGTSRGQGTEIIKELNLNTARAYFWAPFTQWTKNLPDGVNPPHTPWAASQYGGKPVTREEAFAAWDRYFAKDFDQCFDTYYPKALETCDMAKQLFYYRDWGMSKGLVFHTQVDGSADRSPDGVNHYYSTYIRYIKKYAPWVDVDFVQLTNEPNYSWWSGQFATTKESVDTWIRVFNRLDKYLRQEFPQTTLLVPCLASSAFFSWGGWKDWTLPILKEAEHPLAYYNYHLYDQGAYTHLAWMEMVQAQTESLGRGRPQGVVTEMNYALYEPNYRERFRFFADQLFTGLAHPDKFAMFHYFLLVYPNWNKKDGGSGNNVTSLIAKRDDELVPNPPYWLYWVLRDTRGQNLFVETPLDPELRAFASRPDPRHLVLSVYNTQEAPRRVALDPNLPAGAAVAKITRSYAHFTGEEIQHGSEDLPAGQPVEFELPGQGVASVKWELAADLPAAANPRREREWFAPLAGKYFADELSVELPVPAVPAPEETAYLRLGAYCDDLLAARGWKLKLNGHDLPVYWSDAPAQVEGDQRTVWWLELPLKPEWLQAKNELRIAAPETAYKLMFASLVYREQPTAELAAARRAAELDRRERNIAAALSVPTAIIAGESRPFDVEVENRRAGPTTYQLAVELPAEIAQTVAPAAEVKVEPGKRARFAGELQGGAVERVEERLIRARLSDDQGGRRELIAKVAVYPRRVAVRMTPTIDGDFADWAKVEPVTFASAETGIKTQTRLAWDDKCLYAAVDVRGPFTPRAPDTLGNFWKNDCVEIFADLGNQKQQMYDADDWQLFFCPVGLDNGPAFGGLLRRERKGDEMKVVETVAEPTFVTKVVKAADGYRLECAVPWEVLAKSFHPVAGYRLGLDVAANHNGQAGSLCASILGLPGKPYSRPDKWGVVTLTE